MLAAMSREYEKTHPWISYKLDLSRAPATLWILLGQASTLCSNIAKAPVKPQTREDMQRLYLAKGVRGTTAIEGNTLSEEQIQQQIRGELEVPPSKAYLQQEVQNVLDACNGILADVRQGQVPELSVELMKGFNRRILNGLEDHLEDGVVPGEIPSHNVVVLNYRGAPRQDCEFLMARLVDWINNDIPATWPVPISGDKVLMALIKSVIAHLYIAWIHPFGDGNGRTARLVEYLLLIRAGIPSTAAHLLSNHYNETRNAYYSELAKASKSGGDVFSFMQYAIQGFVDGVAEHYERVRGTHLLLAWESYVYEQFRGEKKTDTSARRRDIALALAGRGVVSKEEIGQLTPAIARAYGNRGPKTVARDLTRLEHLGLVSQAEGGYRANLRKLLDFMPLVHDPAG